MIFLGKLFQFLAELKTSLYTWYYFFQFGSLGERSWVMGKLRIYGNPEDIFVGEHSRLHDGVMLNCYKGKIRIGNNVVLSPDARLITASLLLKKHYKDRTHLGKDIVLGDDVWVSTNATVIGGVTIGEGSIVGTGSVVTKDVPSFVLVGGVPARIIKKLED